MGNHHKGIHPLSLGKQIGEVHAIAGACPDCGQAAMIMTEMLIITPERVLAPGKALGKATSGTRYALCLWCGRRQKLEMQANGQWKLIETRQGTPPEVKTQ